MKKADNAVSFFRKFLDRKTFIPNIRTCEQNKKMIRRITAFLLVGLLVFTFPIVTLDTVQANVIPLPEKLATEHGYIMSNGTIEPPTLPIKRQGNIYRLTDNIVNYTFEIQANNIIIDGNGYLFSIPAYGEVDRNYQVKGATIISVSESSNILLKNINLSKFSSGIDIRNSTNIIAFNNTMQNGNTGIYMLRSANCSILANTINGNSLRGMLIQDCTSINVSYNEISNNGYAGIEIDDLTRQIFSGMKDSNFTHNTFSNHKYGLYFLGHHSNNRVFENNFIGNEYGGISFMHAPSVNNSILNNYWKNNLVQINDYLVEKKDPSPLATQISIEFNQSLFSFPSFAEKPTSTPLIVSIGTFIPTTVIITIILVTVIAITLRIHRKKTIAKS